jgi:hypothetical protein
MINSQFSNNIKEGMMEKLAEERSGSWKAKVLANVLLILFVAWVFWPESEKAKVKEFDPKDAEPQAIAAAQVAVKDQLKSPSTAHFPIETVKVFYRGDKTFDVAGAVDAQNAFGAKLRTNWGVTVKKSDDPSPYAYDVIAVKVD